MPSMRERTTVLPCKTRSSYSRFKEVAKDRIVLLLLLDEEQQFVLTIAEVVFREVASKNAMCIQYDIGMR